MKLLLDTHIILWALDDNPKLSELCKKMGYHMLLITDKHVGALETLVFHSEHQVHNDPFDRIMIA